MKVNRTEMERLFFVSTALVFFFSIFVSPAIADDSGSQPFHPAKGFAHVVKKAGPAVVHVRVEKSMGRQPRMPNDSNHFFEEPFFEHFFGPRFRQPERERRSPHRFKQRGAGSGFIIGEEGYILTNNHVVEGADVITVRLADEREFKAKIVGTDPQSDVAVIKIDGKDLPVLPLGDSNKIEVGEWVIAIGSPFELSQSVTVGVVSAKGRSRMGINDYENFIQTDAAINPGNSGGPLLNTSGEAVGINTAIFSRSGGNMGIGFAIPINMAKNIEKQLKSNGKVTRGWLGVVIQDVTEALARSFGLEQAEGILVAEVAEDSPAARGGLSQGDVIVGLDGVQVKGVDELRNKVAMITPGTTVAVTVIRDRSKKEIKVKIGEQPSDMGGFKPGAEPSMLEELGISLQNLTPELAKRFGYQNREGVLVASVEPSSPAAGVGLRSGQLIEEVNKHRVSNLGELSKVIEKERASGELLLRVRSGRMVQYIVLELN
ncbi:MAG: DegQ family serine endoprotease [Thermodesulfobacteriota bacterium]